VRKYLEKLQFRGRKQLSIPVVGCVVINVKMLFPNTRELIQVNRSNEWQKKPEKGGNQFQLNCDL
jgi:hypothetical protein